MLKPVAMVGWSGLGSFDDLEATVLRKLGARKADMDRVGGTLLISVEEPVAAARSLAFLPGVAWIAVGYRFTGTDGYLKVLNLLAKRYLSKGKTFRISANSVRSKQSGGDLILSGNSELLSSVPGVKVDEGRPRVRFRVSIDGAKGACGAEIRTGPGGSPTGDDWVACLVSGGERSSSMVWMAALSGFSLRLVHSWTDDAALRRVAKLYSELSFRMDPRCLELVVLEGGKSPMGRIGRWLHDHDGATFAGLQPERPQVSTELARKFPNLSLPLVFVQDDSISAIFRSLGLGPVARKASSWGMTPKALEAATPYSEIKFGGVQADLNTVIDAIKRRV